ncbi:hypothetical protein LTR37_010717 [Vermiconidia calcicola]|uniref:Uncharacterized protein n=1 Tax=Vermiconidia calcicola TaxID=1690605 RepID=A0ACC3N440_9PEZI|nr:hypothetical protein LTR37_010717 [Vermiconidia calcicola]
MNTFVGINADGTPARSSSSSSSSLRTPRSSAPPFEQGKAPTSVFDNSVNDVRPNGNAPVADMGPPTSYTNRDRQHQAVSWPPWCEGAHYHNALRDASDTIERLAAEVKTLQQERHEDRKDIRREVRRLKDRHEQYDETTREIDTKTETLRSDFKEARSWVARLETSSLTADAHARSTQDGKHLEMVNRLDRLEAKVKANAESTHTLGFTVNGRFPALEKKIDRDIIELKAEY